MNSLERERHASWLELFYDLVFASAVSQIGHSLYVNNNSIMSFLGTISLFVPVWWAWIGVTFYAARFETDDRPSSFCVATDDGSCRTYYQHTWSLG